MSRRGTTRPDPLNTTLVGAIAILVVLIAVVLSYNANRGLPFVPTIGLRADVPDAARLVAGSSEVRIGGARVGLVQEVTAIRKPERPPFARIRMTLDPAQRGLPADTRIAIRPRSLLGAKYVELIPGRSTRRLAPDATLPLRQAVPVVELSDTFDIFDPTSTRALQNSITSLGNALAGRGSALNASIDELHRTFPPLQRVLRAITSPAADLGGFIAALARVTDALTSQRTAIGGLLDGAEKTVAAIDAAGPQLGASITELARTETVAVPALGRLDPVLDDAAAIARDLRPAARELPQDSAIIAAGLEDATPGLKRVPELRRPLQRALDTVARVAAAPASASAVRKLTAAVNAVGSTLDVVAPAQRHCNMVGLFFRNTGSVIDEGDENGNWARFVLILGGTDEILQSDRPAARLHYNPYPRENATECEGGNEPFGPGQLLGNVPGVQNGREETAPPPGVRERGARAGLLAGPSEGGR